MPLSQVLLLLSAFWIVVHGLNYSLTSRNSSSLLPVASSSTGLRTTTTRSWNISSTRITVEKLLIKVQTNSVNALHDTLANRLKSRQWTRLRRWVIVFYDLGVLFGVLGMVSAIGILAYTAGMSGLGLLRDMYMTQTPQLGQLQLAKRDLLEDDFSNQRSLNSQGFIQPIIPGVTVPLSHLPLILTAVFIGQLVHELGHLLSGALESVPMLSAGISITVVIPSAFVSFSTVFLENLKPPGKARIIAAGPWHNLVFWLTLLSAAKVANVVHNTTGLGIVFSELIWKDVRDLGRVVVDVDEDSPLKEFLRPGTIITALDDVSLAQQEDFWTNYLLHEKQQSLNSFGWCVGSDMFPEESASSTCCTGSNPTNSSASILSCFISLNPRSDVNTRKVCLDPFPILTNTHQKVRCSKNEDCVDTTRGAGLAVGASVCVRPEDPKAFLRLKIKSQTMEQKENDADDPDDEEIVLWNGPSREVWEQVVIGESIPRYWFIPLWESVIDFWSYINMATLSLYLFNLLPLPHLDGSQFLDVLLSWMVTTSGGITTSLSMESDMELGLSRGSPEREHGRGDRWRWARRVEKLVRGGTLIALGLCVGIGLVRMMLGNGYVPTNPKLSFLTASLN